MKLFHATYRAHLNSIFAHGLGAVQKKNWDISVDGSVCFAEDMDLAISFCEAADKVSDEVFDSGIVCLEVDSESLMDELLFLDHNFLPGDDDDAWCFLYEGVVPPEHLKVCWKGNLKDVNEGDNMIVDLILDRKDSRTYNAHDFYMACMGYGRIADDITRAMDGGTEADVKAALCKYIVDNEYNPLLCDYIRRINWIGKTPPAIEEAAAVAFENACKAREAEASLDDKLAQAKAACEEASGRCNTKSEFVKE